MGRRALGGCQHCLTGTVYEDASGRECDGCGRATEPEYITEFPGYPQLEEEDANED